MSGPEIKQIAEALAPLDDDQRADLLRRVLEVARSMDPRDRKEPTRRQQAVLDLVRASMLERGFAPTVREMGDVLGINSTNGVMDHIKALERKGWIERTPGTQRGLRLL